MALFCKTTAKVAAKGAAINDGKAITVDMPNINGGDQQQRYHRRAELPLTVEGPNWCPRGLNWGPRGPNWCPRGPNWGPRGPNWGPRGPNWGPRGPNW
eukprot:gene15894-biopygen8202